MAVHLKTNKYYNKPLRHKILIGYVDLIIIFKEVVCEDTMN